MSTVVSDWIEYPTDSKTLLITTKDEIDERFYIGGVDVTWNNGKKSISVGKGITLNEMKIYREHSYWGA